MTVLSTQLTGAAMQAGKNEGIKGKSDMIITEIANLMHAGEDEDMKRMMWVVENLQEELLAADEARLAADRQVQACSKVVQGLQVRAHALINKPLQESIEYLKSITLVSFR